MAGTLKTIRRRWRRSLCEVIGNDRYSRPALNGLDTKLERYMDHDGGFFIEVGANDGYAQSNTYYFEKLRGWRGILIEGIPELNRECRRNRKRSRVFDCALVADDHRGSHVAMRYANLMSLVEGAMPGREAEAAHIREGLAVQKLEASYTVDVPVRTLTSILEECEVGEIDLFSLDVEGYELQVLKGLDLTRYQPKFICVEARDRAGICSHLDAFYTMEAELSELDVLFKRRPKVT